MSIVREKLMKLRGYSPYCGNNCCSGRMPRTKWDGEQFKCPACGWRSAFPDRFIKKYKDTWELT